MKKLFVLLASVLIFCGVAFADSFCEENYGVPFFSDRNLAEAQMSSKYGNPVRIQNFSTWQVSKDAAYTLYFKQDKVVGATTMIVVEATETNLKAIMQTFNDMRNLIDKASKLQFIKEVDAKFEGISSRGLLYACKNNKIERMVLYVTKESTGKLVGLSSHSYLKGFGLREFD